MKETLTRNGEKSLANMNWSHAGEWARCVFLIALHFVSGFHRGRLRSFHDFETGWLALDEGLKTLSLETEICTRGSILFSLSMEPYPLALLNLGLACDGNRVFFFCVGAGSLAARTLSLCALTGLQEKTANAVFEFPADAAGRW